MWKTLLEFKDYQEIGRRVRDDEKERKELQKKRHEEYLKNIGVTLEQTQGQKPTIYHYNTIPKVAALLITILVMITSLIFKQWYIAWIGVIAWYFHTERP